MFVTSAQSRPYANPEYYLIDSLRVDQIPKADRALLDSCLHMHHQATTDTAALRAIINYVEESWNESVWPRYNKWVHERVEELLAEGPSKAQERSLMRLKAETINNFGYYAQNHESDLNRALDYFYEALDIRKRVGDSLNLAAVYNNIASIHKHRGNLEEALELHHHALRLFDRADDVFGVAYQLSNIGMILHQQGDREQALEYLQKSLKMRESIGDRHGMATSYVNIAHTLHAMQNSDSALYYYQKGLENYEALGHKRGMATAYNNLGRMYEVLERYDESREHYERSLELRAESGDIKGMAITLRNVAELLKNTGDLAGARQRGEEGLRLAQEIGHPLGIQVNAGFLSQLAATDGRFEDAFKLRNLEIAMRDSLANIEAVRKATQLHANYEYEKKSAADKATIAEQELALSKSFNRQILLISGLLLGLLLVGVLYQRLRLARIKNELSEKKKQLDLSLVISDNKVRHEFEQQLLKKLEDLKHLEGDQLRRRFNEYIIDLKNQIHFEKKLDHLSDNIHQLHDEFELNLKERFPALTPSEIEICHMFRLNMTTKEIAVMKGTSEGAIRTSRYRIKTKLGLQEESLDEYIKNAI